MYRTPTLIFVALLLAACAPDPSKDAPAATVHESEPKEEKASEAEATAEAKDKPEAAPEAAKEPAKPAAPVPKTATEPSPSEEGHIRLGGRVGFVGSKVTASQECMFREWSGTAIAGEKDTDWTLKIDIDAKSVFCNPDERKEWSAKLDKHLRSEDFFHVEKFPKATFESTEVRVEAEGDNTHVIKGNLTLRGKTKLVSFPARIQITEKRVTGKAEFSINRKDFGIVYPGKADDLIRDGVVLKLQFSGSRV